MEIITHKYADGVLTTNIHGNRLEKAAPENIKTKIVAGTSKKDGQLYVLRKSCKTKPGDTYRCLVTDYIVKDELKPLHTKWYYFRHRLYWLWQNLLNMLFSINPKGMLLANEVNWIIRDIAVAMHAIAHTGYSPNYAESFYAHNSEHCKELLEKLKS